MTTNATARGAGSELYKQGLRDGVAGLRISRSDVGYLRGHEAGLRRRNATFLALANIVAQPYNSNDTQSSA